MALVIFITAFAAFLSVVESPAHGSTDAPQLDGAATAGLAGVIDTAGHYVNGGTKAKAWQLDPEKMGPVVPEHAEVASAARIATAPHPVLADQRVLVRVTLHVFR